MSVLAGGDSSGEFRHGPSNLNVYLPPQALQGEDLPSFALWKDAAFRMIEVRFPSGLEVHEVYNVAPEDYMVEPEKLTVRRVEVNGYLGISFSSHHFETTAEEVDVRFDFHELNGKVDSRTCKVFLFRPLLAVKKMPETIRIDASRLQPLDSIQVANEGIGTIRMGISSEEGSELPLKEPAIMSDFRANFRKDLEAGLNEVGKAFPEETAVLETLKEVWLKPIDLEDKAALTKMKSASDSFRKAATNCRKFGEAMVETLVGALLKNLSLFNLLEQLVDFFHSVPAKKILLLNPFDVIEIGPKPAVLKVKLVYTDLANGDYEPVKVQTTVVAEQRCELPVYRLLEWVSGDQD